MSAEQSASVATTESPRAQWLDLVSIAVCTLAWGTTWFTITLQFGVVDPVISIVYRFGLAAALLFVWCKIRGERVWLTRAQHLAAFGVGFSTFAINYTLVYWAEERVTSAVVAVLFAAMAFLNLVAFRFAFGQRSPPLAWAAAGLGVAGVALMSWEEISAANFGAAAMTGIAMTLTGVIGTVVGNVYARRGELAGAGIAASTGWAMAYGAGSLAVFALVTGKTWAFEPTWEYALSLLHLAVNGSVVAFILYYTLARRRGYGTASYISALTPPVAMIVSSLFEAKTWGGLAFGGVALVLAGQVLLLRSRRTA